MMNILKKIKNILYYGDTGKEEYYEIRDRIEESNRTTALFFTTVAFVLIMIMYELSYFVEGLVSSRPVYIFGTVFSAIQVVIALLSRKYRYLTYVSVYMAISVFLVYGIMLGTITRPEEMTVTFMVMLIFVPLIFVDRPVRMAVVLMIYDIIYIVMAIKTKPQKVLFADLSDAVIFGILAVASETIVYRSKIRALVLENRLHIMSETDQLTGLNNRNCYELKLKAYENLYKNSIACVYIDVNGLHELNNAKGHKAGDEMLCFIADTVKRQFGESDSFRIGGDEFVSFVMDRDKDEMISVIEEMTERFSEEGYHAATGLSFSTERNTDINKLIVRAESAMYKNKSEYYKDHKKEIR